ncbi:MAG: hypothetical protein KGL39_50775 [Patescibacteria group bacterium]|nr:hypothetical protein [Patescibacteria group bacterium]
MSNQTITPLVGTLIMTTFVGISSAITPNTGTLVMTTFASANASIQPATAALNTTGYLPTQTYQEAPPATAALAFTGNAPVIGSSQSITTLSGALNFAGSAPNVRAVVQPISGSLNFSGNAPGISYGITPAAGGLALTGVAPSAGYSQSAAPNTGLLAFAGAAPGLGLSIAPPTGVLALQGFAPFTVPVVIINSATLSLNGQQPLVSLGIAPASAALSLVPSAPVLSSLNTLQAPTGVVSFGGNAPIVVQTYTIQPATGAIALSGLVPLTPATIAPPTASLAMSGSAPQAGYTIAPAAGTLQSASAAPLAAVGYPVLSGQAVLQGYAPVIAQTFNGTITPITGAVNFILVLCDPLETALPGTFSDIVIVETNPSTQPYISAPEPFAFLFQRVGEQITYGIDWTGWLQNRWEAGTAASTGSVIRPSIATGFQYLCTSAGTTGGSEPMWPAYAGEVTLDGSAQWMCKPIDNTSLEATVSGSSWSAPAAIGLFGNFLVAQMSVITVDTTNAVSGQQYDVLATVTFSDGQRKVGKIRIQAV